MRLSVILLLSFCAIAQTQQIDTTGITTAFVNSTAYAPLSKGIHKYAAIDSVENVITGKFAPVYPFSAVSDSFLTSVAADSLGAFDGDYFTSKAGAILLDNFETAELNDFKDGNCTIVMIVQVRADAAANQVLFQYAAGTTDGIAWSYMHSTTQKIYFGVDDGSNRDRLTNASLALNQWKHYTFVYNNTSQYMRFYVDGVVDTTLTWTTGPFKAGTTRLNIADFNFNQGAPLRGWVKLFATYGDAKSDAWVAAEFAKFDANMELLPILTSTDVGHSLPKIKKLNTLKR